MADSNVRFGGRLISLSGLATGAGIAIGLPYIILTQGQNLGTGVETTLIIIAMVVGGGVALVSAFFGLVIPTRVGP